MTGRTYTHPDVFTVGVSQGWAEPETDPTRIDWPTRQAAAAIPFAVVDGRPVNPCEQTAVRYGRNEMGYWGETLMADALVTVTLPPFGARYLLMVERDDGYGWAVPGGHVEPGESGTAAALRELAEETGLTVLAGAAVALPPRYVPDPRASDEAWAVTVPVRIDLGERDTLPEVAGGDDARRAEWIPADTFACLGDALTDLHGGRVFAAHAAMLAEFLTPPPRGLNIALGNAAVAGQYGDVEIRGGITFTDDGPVIGGPVTGTPSARPTAAEAAAAEVAAARAMDVARDALRAAQDTARTRDSDGGTGVNVAGDGDVIPFQTGRAPRDERQS